MFGTGSGDRSGAVNPQMGRHTGGDPTDAHQRRTRTITVTFPDPDLLPVRHTEVGVEEKCAPPRCRIFRTRRSRDLASDFGISAYAASVLASEQALANYFEAAR